MVNIMYIWHLYFVSVKFIHLNSVEGPVYFRVKVKLSLCLTKSYTMNIYPILI